MKQKADIIITMNIDLASKKLTVRDITTKTFIPNNPKAKLMYYLNCISEVLISIN